VYKEMLPHEGSAEMIYAELISTPVGIVLDIREDTDDAYVHGDWHMAERTSTASYRWTGEEGYITLYLDPSKEYQLELRIVVGAVPRNLKQRAYVNGKFLGDVRRYGNTVLTITPEIMDGNPEINITIESDTWVPAGMGNSIDIRNLGAFVERVKLTLVGSESPISDNMQDAKIRKVLDTDVLYNQYTDRYGEGFCVYYPYSSQEARGFHDVVQDVVVNSNNHRAFQILTLRLMGR
jgi:hypothetical protein